MYSVQSFICIRGERETVTSLFQLDPLEFGAFSSLGLEFPHFFWLDEPVLQVSTDLPFPKASPQDPLDWLQTPPPQSWSVL